MFRNIHILQGRKLYFMSQSQKRSDRCMIVISVYGELPLPTISYRLSHTLAVAKLVDIFFTDNSKGRESRLPIKCFKNSVFTDVLTIAKVVLNYMNQILNFLKKLTIS